MRNGPIDPDVFRRAESGATKTFSLSADPPIFVSGSGTRLSASDGRSYLDFASGSGTSNVGHGNPAVLAAVRAQLESGITHIGPHFHTSAQARFFEDLLRVLPDTLTRLHPATNGTEATEAALKACMHFTGARTFLAFTGGYHGRTLGALAVSHARGANAGLAPFAPAAEFAPYPGTEEDAETVTAGAVRAIAERPGSAPPLAGVIVEPLQATAGVHIPPDGFLEAVSEAARKSGTPLILDEIFTGFGRTGHLFACEASGVAPDLLLMGKSMGGGFPGGLVAGRGDILSAWPRGAQSSTFQLHPVTAAAGAAALRYLIEHDLCARARMIETRIESHRASLCASPLTKELRGTGATFGLEVRAAGTVPCGEVCRLVRLAALHGGLLTWECGTGAEVIGLMPPLTASKQDIDEGCSRLRAALAAVEADLGSAG